VVVVILALLTAAVTAAVNKSYLDSKTMLVRTVVAAEHIQPYTELSDTKPGLPRGWFVPSCG
jgi:hypothetical protein